MKKRAALKDLDLGPLQAFQERKSLGEHVFESLKQAIVRGKMSSGEWLVESHIAETLGISRTPVREAFHKLEREGFIERQPRGGFTVLGLNREDIEETFGIRSVLEGYAAHLAAIKHEVEELEMLEQKIEEFQIALDSKKMNLLPGINTEFHDLLYGLSKSPRLINMITPAVRLTCSPPRPSRRLRIDQSILGSSSRPTRNSIMTTPNSAKCCRVWVSSPTRPTTGPMTTPAIR